MDSNSVFQDNMSEEGKDDYRPVQIPLMKRFDKTKSRKYYKGGKLLCQKISVTGWKISLTSPRTVKFYLL